MGFLREEIIQHASRDISETLLSKELKYCLHEKKIAFMQGDKYKMKEMEDFREKAIYPGWNT